MVPCYKEPLGIALDPDLTNDPVHKRFKEYSDTKQVNPISVLVKYRQRGYAHGTYLLTFAQHLSVEEQMSNFWSKTVQVALAINVKQGPTLPI